ncbi:UNVERIFIED_CONTAM: hypothetical protein RMT77_017030 [Armadillidium vulgare]
MIMSFQLINVVLIISSLSISGKLTNEEEVLQNYMFRSQPLLQRNVVSAFPRTRITDNQYPLQSYNKVPLPWDILMSYTKNDKTEKLKDERAKEQMFEDVPPYSPPISKKRYLPQTDIDDVYQTTTSNDISNPLQIPIGLRGVQRRSNRRPTACSFGSFGLVCWNASLRKNRVFSDAITNPML